MVPPGGWEAGAGWYDQIRKCSNLLERGGEGWCVRGGSGPIPLLLLQLSDMFWADLIIDP
jgi:hypothetical protein